ncbi:MAG: aminopeptidase P family protein [Chloroflexi bacterium]|nr:aminopeptidase P family protein [Chloroflexota bacterium]
MWRGRVDKFQEKLRHRGLSAAIVSATRDIYYLAGTAQQSWLIVPAEGEPTLLIIRDFERGRAESQLPDIREIKSPSAIRDVIIEKRLAKHGIGITEDVAPASFVRRMAQLLPEAEFVDVSLDLRRVRMVKDDEEIARIRKAAEIADWGHKMAVERLRAGISELEASAEIELELVRHGHDGYLFTRNLGEAVRQSGVYAGPSLYVRGGLAISIPGAGSTPLLGYGPSRRIIEVGDTIVLDLVGSYMGYLCDEARTYAIGKASDGQNDIVEALKYIIHETMPNFRPGVSAAEVYSAAVRAAGQTRYADFLMGPKARNIKFVGHGVGIELDELPVLTPSDNTLLEPGMVIAFEPIIVVPEVGASTLENTILITQSGHEVLCTRPVDMLVL